VYTNTVKGLGQLSIRLKDADVIILNRERTHLPRALIEKLPKLKLVVQTGRIGAHVDINACTERGIAVAEGTGSPIAPAELTWALIMAASRRLTNYASLLQQGTWQASSVQPAHNRLGRVLKQRRLGIWGYGKIGKRIASYATAFGMHVIIWGGAASRAQAVQDGYQAAASREAFFADSDIVTLHLRLNDATRGIVQAADLARMKPDALFVNTSRAELLAPDALVHALDAGRPGFAAIDVFETEPVTQNHPLLHRENVLVTPHIGYVEQDSYELYFAAAFQNILNFAAGTPTNLLQE